MLDIRAAGLCHSDVGALTDPAWLDYIPNRPVVIGHEIAGVVSAVGEGVTSIVIGDRVGVCPSNGHGAPGYCATAASPSSTAARPTMSCRCRRG